MRDNELIRKRDKVMIEAFHQLYNIKRKLLDDVLTILSKNFFLTEDYIYKRIFKIMENSQYYDTLVHEKH